MRCDGVKNQGKFNRILSECQESHCVELTFLTQTDTLERRIHDKEETDGGVAEYDGHDEADPAR
jgi:hypothetical protein